MLKKLKRTSAQRHKHTNLYLLKGIGHDGIHIILFGTFMGDNSLNIRENIFSIIQWKNVFVLN